MLYNRAITQRPPNFLPNRLAEERGPIVWAKSEYAPVPTNVVYNRDIVARPANFKPEIKKYEPIDIAAVSDTYTSLYEGPKVRTGLDSQLESLVKLIREKTATKDPLKKAVASVEIVDKIDVLLDADEDLDEKDQMSDEDKNKLLLERDDAESAIPPDAAEEVSKLASGDVIELDRFARAWMASKQRQKEIYTSIMALSRARGVREGRRYVKLIDDAGNESMLKKKDITVLISNPNNFGKYYFDTKYVAFIYRKVDDE